MDVPPVEIVCSGSSPIHSVDAGNEESSRGPPITINELVQLSHIGIPNDQVTWSRVTMTSDKWIAVRHDSRTDFSAKRAVVTVLSPIEGTISYAGSTSADSVLMNPSLPMIALKASSPPEQVFLRHNRLAFTEIVSYKGDPSLTWLALTGLTPEDERISGVTQLYNRDEDITQCISAHAVCFSSYHFPGNPYPSTVFCVSSREAQDHGKVHVIELGPYKTGNFAPRNCYDHLHFLDDIERYDFPVSLQISVDYGLLFVVTKYGYLYMCDMETAMCLCCTRVSVDVIFAAVLNTNSQGILAITRGGQVITVDLKKDGFISFLREQVKTAYRANRFEQVICQ
ncbi:hypothetical protein Btru_002226 [Bulinus truncatus]|nr:hypothetical protein Btru_002226 [Bulinus truncatus]